MPNKLFCRTMSVLLCENSSYPYGTEPSCISKGEFQINFLHLYNGSTATNKQGCFTCAFHTPVPDTLYLFVVCKRKSHAEC